MENIDILCILGLRGWAVLVKPMPTDQPNMVQSNFLIIFNLKYKNIVGPFFAKSCCIPKLALLVPTPRPMAVTDILL